MAEVQLKITAKDDTRATFSAVQANAKSAFDGIQSAAEQYTSRVKSVFDSLKQHWLAVTATIAAAWIIVQKAWHLAEQAAAFEEQKTRLNSLAAAYGTTADSIIDSLKHAAGGTISMAEAVGVAGRAMLMGINPQGMIDMMELAKGASEVTGQSVVSAFDSITTTLATGNERSLKSMGIIVDLSGAYDRYAKSIGTSANLLDDEQRQTIGLNVLLQKKNEILQQLGPSMDSNADKMAKFTATMKDWALIGGDLVIRVGAAMIGGFTAIGAAINTAIGAIILPIQKIFEATSHLPSKFGDVSKSIAGALKSVTDNSFDAAKMGWNTAGDAYSVAFRDVAHASEGAAKGIANVGNAAGDAKPKIVQLADALFSARRALAEAQSADAANDVKKQSEAVLLALETQHSRGLVSDEAYYAERRAIIDKAYTEEFSLIQKQYDETEAARKKTTDPIERTKLDTEAVKQITAMKNASYQVEKDRVDLEDKAYASTQNRIKSYLAAEASLAIATGEHVAAVYKQIEADQLSRAGMDAVTKEILDQVDALKLMQAEYDEAHANDALANRVASLQVAEDPYTSQLAAINQRYDAEIEKAQWAYDTKLALGQDASKEMERLSLIEQARTLETENFKISEWKRGAQSFADSIGTIGDVLMKGNKEQFEVGKRMAISSAMIDTYLSAQRAFTSLVGIEYIGPALAVTAATAAVAAGLQRVAYINAQHYATGGFISGGRPNEDSVPAMLMPGEYVLPVSLVNKLGADNLERARQTGDISTLSSVVDLTAYRTRKYKLGGFVGDLIDAGSSAVSAIVNPVVYMNSQIINGAEAIYDMSKKPDIPAVTSSSGMSQAQLDQDLARRLQVLNGATEDQLRLYDLRITQDKELKDAQSAGLNVESLITVQSREYAKAVQDIADLQKKAQTALNQDVTSRLLRAQGNTAAADLYDLQIRQEKELTDAKEKGLDVTKLLQVQTFEWANAVKEATKTVSEAQQKLIDFSKKTVTDLISFQSGILGTLKGIMTGPQAMLSPEAAYSQALQRFQTAGEKDLSAAATALLEASKNYNASSPAYQADLNMVLDKLGIAAGIGPDPTFDKIASQQSILEDIKAALNDGSLSSVTGQLKETLGAGSALWTAIVNLDKTTADIHQENAKNAAVQNFEGLLPKVDAAHELYKQSVSTYTSALSTYNAVGKAYSLSSADDLLKMFTGLTANPYGFNIADATMKAQGVNYTELFANPAKYSGSIVGQSVIGYLDAKSGMTAPYNTFTGLLSQLQTAFDDAVRLGAAGLAMPSYDIGTPFVPYDMSARVHREEMVVDPISSGVLRKYGIRVQGNTPDLSILTAKIEALTRAVEKLEAHAAGTEKNTADNVRVNQYGHAKTIEAAEKQARSLAGIASKASLAAAS